MGISVAVDAEQKFKDIIYRYYRRHGRSFPWRNTRNPYRILVSELMLQQTQTERVVGKYPEFLRRFPGFPALARAPLKEVLQSWQGLGYNRRALALKRIGEIVMREYRGRLPLSEDVLLSLPGIGRASAGAVLAFAGNRPAVFLETNIRRVFLSFFFPGRSSVPDEDLLPLVEQTLDRSRPREWYFALMDYGAYLRSAPVNPNRRSAHFRKQAPFPGSDRQVRGTILRMLLRASPRSPGELSRQSGLSMERIAGNLAKMESEGLVVKHGRRFSIP